MMTEMINASAIPPVINAMVFWWRCPYAEDNPDITNATANIAKTRTC